MLSITMFFSPLLLLLTTNSIYMWYMSPPMLMLFTLMFMMKYLNSYSYMMLDSDFALDSMSTMLIMLTLWITAMMFMASSKIKQTHNMPSIFGSLMLTMCLILIMCFSVSNMLMFYMLFETSLIPIMLMIMMWGYQPERSQASMYLFMYTVAASLPLLTIIFKLYHTSEHLNMTMNMEFMFPMSISPLWLGWLMLMMAFMVKLPMYSMHLWLPKAHVEAPVAGSMILAAVLLKLGSYGMLRSYMMFPHMNKLIMSPIISLSLVGALITSMICMRQTDLKSLIAYSSVGHMGLLLSGVMTSSTWGLMGAMAMMIAHGMSSSALFMMANLNYEIYNTRSMFLMKGMMSIIPMMSLWWFMFMACNMAAPPTMNLLSEVVLMTSILYTSKMTAIILALISFYSVAYSLYMYSSINHGHPNMVSLPKVMLKPKDMSLMILHIYPIVALMFKPTMITSWM